MNIRRAELMDLNHLAELFDQYRIFYKKNSDLESARLFLKTRMEKKESEIFVSFNDEGKMTGFTQLYPSFSSTRLKRFWILNDLFVHQDFRGQGYAIALIEKAKELCRNSGACGMMLETGKDNVVGNKLYPKTGFYLDEDNNFYEWEV